MPAAHVVARSSSSLAWRAARCVRARYFLTVWRDVSPAATSTHCVRAPARAPTRRRRRSFRNQWRAIYTRNCAAAGSELLVDPDAAAAPVGTPTPTAAEEEAVVEGGDEVRPPPHGFLRPLACAVCTTKVGVMDSDEVCHFFHVIPG